MSPADAAAVADELAPMLRALCVRWCRGLDRSHRDDAFQIAWMAAWRVGRWFDRAKAPAEACRAWAVRNARVAVLKYVYRELRHLDRVADRPPGEPWYEDDPAGRAEVRDWVRWAVAQLGYDDRAVVDLRYALGDGYEYRMADAARVLGVSVVRAYQRERKALAELRPLLESFA